MAGAAVSTAPAAVELDDIQGLARFAYKNHTEAVFLLLRITDSAAARAWLGRAALTDAVSREPPPRTALQVALTSEGLRALGVVLGGVRRRHGRGHEPLATSGGPGRERSIALALGER